MGLESTDIMASKLLASLMASLHNMYLLQHAKSVITQFLYYQIQFKIYFLCIPTVSREQQQSSLQESFFEAFIDIVSLFLE